MTGDGAAPGARSGTEGAAATRPLERLIAAVVVALALVHTASLLPTVPELLRVVPPHAARMVWLLATTVVTAVLACALGIVLVVRAGARRDALALALFLGFLAACWGSVLRFADVHINPDGTGSLTVGFGGIQGLGALVGYCLATAAYLRFTSVFPEPLTEGSVGTGGAPWPASGPVSSIP